MWGTARAPSALVVWTMQSARASTQARIMLWRARTCRVRDAWLRIDCRGKLEFAFVRGGYGWMDGWMITIHLVSRQQMESRRVHACSSTLLAGACARAVK